MLQRSGEQSGQLLIDYSRFPFAVGDNAARATLQTHLVQITRLLLIKMLAFISTNPESVDDLSIRDKDTISYLSFKVLQELSARELDGAISTITTWDTRFRRLADWYHGDGKDLVRRALSQLASGATAALGNGLINVDIENSNEMEARLRESGSKAWDTSELETINQYFFCLIDACTRMGFKKVVVLVDSVDEVDGTGKAGSAFAFVRPLLTNLYLFDEKNLAFRIFLWDRLDKHCGSQNGVRRDRLVIHRIKWNVDQLVAMLRKRIESASLSSSFNSLVSDSIKFDVDRIICHAAAGSPRDMIRICREIIRQHDRQGDADQIQATTIRAAIQSYCSDRLHSLCDSEDEIRYLARMDGYGLTKDELASVWGMRQETDEWIRRFRELSLIKVVGKVRGDNNQEENVYGYSDLRVAIGSRLEDQPSSVFAKASICPTCKTQIISDKARICCEPCKDARYSRRELKSAWVDCQVG